MGRLGRLLAAASVFVLWLSVLTGGQALAGCGPWERVPKTAAPGVLFGVDAGPAGDAWAVGWEFSEGRPLTLHWTGTAWRNVPAPRTSDADFLHDVKVIQTDDVWAVGSIETNNHTLILHWDGEGWSVVSSPNPSGKDILTGVDGTSSTDVWAVGISDFLEPSETFRTLVAHWDGEAWTVVPSPNPTSFNLLWDVLALSPTDAWAVGSTSDGQGGERPLVLHWDGVEWTEVPTPDVGTEGRYSGLRSVAGASSNEVWAVGYEGLDDGDRPLIERWDGTAWTVVPGDTRAGFGDLRSVVALSTGKAVAVGSRSQNEGLIEEWNGTRWKALPPGEVPTAHLQSVTGTRSVLWAAGYTDRLNTVIMRGC